MSRRSARRSLRKMLGVPLVPPGRVTRALLGVRRGLGRGHRSSVPPQIRVLEGLLSVLDNRVLGLLVDLDIAEAAASPATAVEIARARGHDPENLERVLRYAVARGFLGQDRRGRYRANDVTELLCDGADDSWAGWVRFAGSPVVAASIRHLDATLLPDGPTGTEVATGQDFFTYVNRTDPDVGRAFNEAMAAGSRLQALALAVALDWDDEARVCDVGGGTGAALEALQQHHPHLHATLFDLPEVVATVVPGLAAAAREGRAEIVAGDFFAGLPVGDDRYLLLAVLHDWSDHEAERILRRVAEAAGDGGEVVVVEAVRPETPVDDFAFVSDLLMLALATGRERSRAEFDDVFAAAGLRLRRAVALPTGFTAFVLANA